MSALRHVSHAEVVIDPDVAVPSWGVTGDGRARVGAMLGQPWVADVGRIISSAEVKAQETAAVLADHLGIEVEVRPATGETDREAVGFVLAARHEELSAAFFAHGERSVHGWERAVDAQARVIDALADVVVDDGGVGIVVVGHGGVGTLLLCHLAGLEIDEAHDQHGAGHSFTYDRAHGTVLHHWHPIDDLGPPPPFYSRAGEAP